MRIEKALAVPTWGGYFNDDLEAIRDGARADGFLYADPPQAPGFTAIRQPSEAASIILLLDNGLSVSGDALSVSYAAAGGRHGLFSFQRQKPYLEQVCAFLEGRSIEDFGQMCTDLEGQEFSPGLHRPAVFYGASQALLQAVALLHKTSCAEVLSSHFGLKNPDRRIPIGIQCGAERYNGVDKAILKRADALPHGLINDIKKTVGIEGELLRAYVSWIAARIRKYGAEDYTPAIHLDLYGTLGQVFGNDPGRIAAYLSELHLCAAPFQLHIETPVLMDSRQAQMDLFGQLRQALAKLGTPVRLIADEWANNLEDIRAFIQAGVTDMIQVKTPDMGALTHIGQAVLECRAGGVGPILGGSCVDTDQAARIMAHLALATRPDWILARPGMGIDEGLQIVHNEMVRTLALIQPSG